MAKSVASRKDVLRALAGFRAADGRDLVSAGAVESLALDGGSAQVILRAAPEAARELGAQVPAIQEALEALPGISTARVLVTAHRAAPSLATPQAAPQSTPQSTPAPRRGQPHKPRRPEGFQGDSGIRRVLAVSSAKGGVGKSTVAANLAFAFARRGFRAGILDADVHGPSLAHLSGLRGVRAPTTQVEGRTLIDPPTAHGVRALSISMLTRDDGPIVWRGPLVQGAITKMLWDAHWGELDVLVIDMPPGTGDPQLALAQDVLPAHPTLSALLVTTPQDLALADLRKGAEMFSKVSIPVVGAVVNMSAFRCPHCGEDTAIFGPVPEGDILEGVDTLARIPLSLALREATERGEPADADSFDALAEAAWERVQ